MGPDLSATVLLETVDHFYRERAAVAAIVAQPGEPWADLRSRLNELNRLLGDWQ